MHEEFWHEKWRKNEIGFHESQANPLLVKNINALKLQKGARIFLPLCGKTLDIEWLLQKGFRVVGAELSQTAIEQLFIQLKLEPEIIQKEKFLHYHANAIDIFVGNIFDLSAEDIDVVDAIYDRAALVALPEAMRKRYTKHLMEITKTAKQLLIAFEYDQSVMAGPPFSISKQEVLQHYEQMYQAVNIESVSVVGGLKGICPAMEHVWLLNQGT